MDKQAGRTALQAGQRPRQNEDSLNARRTHRISPTKSNPKKMPGSWRCWALLIPITEESMNPIKKTCASQEVKFLVLTESPSAFLPSSRPE